MIKKLIVNADDFGIGEKITDGIIDCHMNGIVTSTTIMTNMPAAEYAANRAKDYPNLGVGVHLVLTQGKPLSRIEDVPDLINNEGVFKNHKEQSNQLKFNKKLYKQVKCEFNAQINRAIELGLNPTHCDSHHGIHRMPIARKAVGDILTSLNIYRIRNQLGYHWASRDSCTADKIKAFTLNMKFSIKIFAHMYNLWSLKKLGIKYPDHKVKPGLMIGAPENEKEALIKALDNINYGVNELIYHPGYTDLSVADSEKFAMTRLSDFKLLTDNDVIKAVKANNIELINFSNF